MTELEKFLSVKSSKKTALMSIASGNYAFCLYVSVLSLIKKSPELAGNSDILLLIKNIPDGDKKILRTLGDNIHVIEFEIPISIDHSHSAKWFTTATFFRYECFNLTDKYDKVLLFDSDIMVQKELSGIFDFLNKDGIGMMPEKVNVSNFIEEVDNIKLPKPGFNAGIIALDKRLNIGKEITKFCYEMTEKYAENLWTADQGIINLACGKFNLDVAKLPVIYNMPASLSGSKLKDAVIIHPTGHRKFWGYYYFNDWYKYYEQWIENGGAPCFAARKDSERYKKFIKKHGLENKVFFQLCPDFFKNPVKALRFALKYLLKIRY